MCPLGLLEARLLEERLLEDIGSTVALEDEIYRIWEVLPLKWERLLFF